MTAEEYFGNWMRVIDKDELMKVMRWIQTLDDSNTCPSKNNIFRAFQLCSLKDFCKVNSSGYAVLTITDSEILKELKRRILTLNLPILSRKWDVIDMSFISKYQTAEILREKVISLYLEGKRNKDISEECGTSPSNVTKIIKQYKKNV